MESSVTCVTPWSRILLEKMIVAQLIKKLPHLLLKPYVHYRYHKTFPLDPLLSQVNQFHVLGPCFFKILSFHLRLGLPSVLFP